MLTSLSKLGRTGTQVVDAARNDVVANLRSLRPILQQLNKAGNDLPNSLELLTSYPFPRNAVDAIKGDYVNLKVTADLDLAGVYGNLTGGQSGSAGSGGSGSGSSGGSLLPSVPSLPTPSALPGLPKLPTAPSATGSASTSSGGGGLLCTLVCTGSQVSYDDGAGDPAQPSRRFPTGVDPALAVLMLKGMQP
jgi:phospholipid/cholesterol/gamma-HCH transport system substrate-binding protein